MRHITRSASIVASVVAGLTLLIATPSGATANEGTPATPVACVMEWSQVWGDVASFIIGPSHCNTELGPISFSTYTLPSGHAKPWSTQRLHAHSPENGGYYGPGAYQLSAPTGSLCNWQSDLYRGTGQGHAPHIHYLQGLNVSWDLSEGNVCEDVSPDGPSPAQPIVGPGQPGPMPGGPGIVEPAGSPGMPTPADAGHGVFGPLAATNDATAMRPAPLIERTSSVATASSSSMLSAWTAAAVVTAMGLAGLGVYGALRRQRRPS